MLQNAGPAACPATPRSRAFSHGIKRDAIAGLNTRLTDEEDHGLAAVQKKRNVTRARLLRKLIRELIGQGPDLLPDELKSFREAVRQVGALGRNLNQAVRAMNAGKAGAADLDAESLKTLLDSVHQLEEELVRVVNRSRKRWVEALK